MHPLLLRFKLYSNISVINITNIRQFFSDKSMFYLNYLIVVTERSKQKIKGSPMITSLSRASKQHKIKISITFAITNNLRSWDFRCLAPILASNIARRPPHHDMAPISAEHMQHACTHPSSASPKNGQNPLNGCEIATSHHQRVRFAITTIGLCSHCPPEKPFYEPGEQ